MSQLTHGNLVSTTDGMYDSSPIGLLAVRVYAPANRKECVQGSRRERERGAERERERGEERRGRERKRETKRVRRQRLSLFPRLSSKIFYASAETR